MSEFCQSYYDILGIERNASITQIKAQYRKLLLQNHPDKQTQSSESSSTERFLEIDKAWKVLSDPQQRQHYDALLKEIEIGQSAPFDLEIQLDEMDFLEETQTYTVDCRCGGAYVITEQQLEEGYNVVPCTSCTLQAQVK